jgi:hypothetical protein
MEEKKKCMCGCSDVRVVACSGASNVGQIANQAAIELAKEEMGCKPPEPNSCLNRGDKVYDYTE